MTIPPQSKHVSGFSHSFDTGVASKTGSLEAAVLYNNLAWWLMFNKDKPEAKKEGKIWSYSSYEEIANRLGYMNKRQVKYAMDKLVEHGFIVKGNFNKTPFDRTTWYSFPDNVAPPQPNDPAPEVSNKSYEGQNCHMPEGSLGSDKIVTSEVAILSHVHIEDGIKEVPYISSPEDAPPSGSPAAKAAPQKNNEFSQEDIKNTDALIERLKVVKSDLRVPVGQKLKSWRNQMRLLREKDGVPSDRILRVINWIGGAGYIHTILSAESFRNKFDEVEHRMRNPIKKFNEPVSKAIPFDHDGNLKTKDTYRNVGY